MNEPNKAVFLSYASQDAKPARRICDALRAAGVEVWFDQNELVGGDAWDQKIRRQIKECALFVPIVSAATQARREGYFRIEWKLAAQRTHAMAEGTPFLLPLVLDGVPEPQALVPPEFRDVQATSLSDDGALRRFCARVQQLLDRPQADAERPRVSAASDQKLSNERRKAPRVAIAVGAFTVLALGITVALVRPWSRVAPAPKPTPQVAAMTRSAELAQRARIETRDELDLAVEQARRRTESAPDSAAAWAARARLEAQYIVRGWDTGEQRRQDTQTHARRALAIDANSADAMFALAVVLLQQEAFPDAEALMRDAIVRASGDAELRQALGTALSGQGREVEALAIRKETLRLFPDNPFAHYDLALSFEKMSPPDLGAALRKFEDSFARGRFANTILHRASLLAGWKGDLPGARQLLESLDPLERTSDRAVGLAMAIALLDHRPERAIEAAGLTAQNYFDDDYVRGPKSWALAHAYAMAGKQHLAQAQWREAAEVLRQRTKTKQGNWFDDAGLAVTLAWLGATDEAARIMEPLESIAQERMRPLERLFVAYYHAGCGDARKTAACLQSILNRRELLTEQTLPLDPWWDKVRGQPEFAALLAKADVPKHQTPDSGLSNPPPADSKSVAVLAFENRSSEKDSEYFSDGVSDELINVLGRVTGLKVVARTSSFTFKGNKAASVREIARALGVAHLVEGSVQQVGGKARVIARLIRADTGEQLWGESFDADVKDILSAQVTTARAIAQAMALRLNAGGRMESLNPEAVQLYLQGRQEWGRRTLEGMRRAEDLFKRAIALEPKFARAHSGLVDVWIVLGQEDDSVGLWGKRDSSEMSRIVERARLAVALDPESAEAHTSLGGALGEAWQPGEARRAFERALELNPNYATAHQWLGRLLLRDGLASAAVASLRRACELDPLSSRMADNLGFSLWFIGRAREGLAELDRALVLQPNAEQAMAQRAMVLATLGRREEAVTQAREVLQRSGSRKMHAVYALAVAGRKDEAARASDSVPKARALSRRASELAALGNWEECLAVLQPATMVPATAEHVLFNPAFDPIRSDPRFVAVLETLGLSGAHARAQAWRAAHPPEKMETMK